MSILRILKFESNHSRQL